MTSRNQIWVDSKRDFSVPESFLATILRDDLQSVLQAETGTSKLNSPLFRSWGKWWFPDELWSACQSRRYIYNVLRALKARRICFADASLISTSVNTMWCFKRQIGWSQDIGRFMWKVNSAPYALLGRCPSLYTFTFRLGRKEKVDWNSKLTLNTYDVISQRS